MKILFPIYRFPYPPITGDRHRGYRQIKMLSKRHSITLVAFYQSKKELAYLPELEKYCEKIYTVKFHPLLSFLKLFKGVLTRTPFNVIYFYSRKMQRVLDKLIKTGEYDVVQAASLRMAKYFFKSNSIARVIDFGDCAALHFKRRLNYKRSLSDILYQIEKQRLERFEAMSADTFHQSYMTSPIDRDASARPEKINVIPVSLDLNGKHLNSVEKMPYSIVFSGNVGYYSDEIAILYFCKEIFPKIKEKIPQVKFHILGRNPTPNIKELAQNDNHIIVTGYVDDLHGYLKKANVAVAPMKVGSGTLIKILEAMDLGVPVISTTLGNGGIGAVDGKSIMLADTADEFAEKTIQLLTDETRRTQIAQDAKQFLYDNFSEDVVLKKTEKLYQEAIDSFAKIK